MSPPREIISSLRRFSDTFIESGTFHGDGAIQALECGFERVFSIEIHKPAYDIARSKCQGKNIYLFHGDSGVLLKRVLKYAGKPSVVFLDAHHVQGIDSGKGESNSPLIHELSILCLSRYKHLICIDDVDYLEENELSYVRLKDVESLLPNHHLEIMDGFRANSLLIATPND